MSATFSCRTDVVAAFAAVLITVGGISTAQAQQQSNPQYHPQPQHQSHAQQQSHAQHQAQAQYREGQQAWGQDNCLYTANSGKWVPTGVCRVFPDPRNTYIWDTYWPSQRERGWIERTDASDPSWYVNYHYATKSFTKVSKTDPRVLYGYANGQWLTPQQIAEMHAQLQPRQPQPAQTAGDWRYNDPDCLKGVTAKTLRENIPARRECQSVAEQQFMDNGNLSVWATTRDAQTQEAQREAQKNSCYAQIEAGQLDPNTNCAPAR